MKVSEVAQEDGLMAASLAQILAVADKLFDALKLAGLPIKGPGMDRRNEASRWLMGLCGIMAEQLKAAPAGDGGIRIKSMGSMPAATPAKTPKKKKETVKASRKKA